MTITDLLQQAGAKIYRPGEHHHVTHGWLGLDCPFCGPNVARLGIPVDRPVVANCWTCGPHSVYDVLLQLGGTALAKLLRKVEFDDVVPQIKRLGRLKLPKGIIPVQRHEKFINFLWRKHVDPVEAFGVWKVKGMTLHKTYPWSLFIPITLDGEVVSFTTRMIREELGGPPYKNASPDEESVSSRDVLFGGDFARRTIIVCEGPLDAMAIGPGGCATLGLAYTRAQVLQMSRFKDRVVCFDAESGAQRVARRLCDELEAFPGKTRNVVLDSGKDPSRASDKERRQLRKMIS